MRFSGMLLGCFCGLLLWAAPVSAAWQLVSVTVTGTTYTVTLRDPTVYTPPAEGKNLSPDPMVSGEYLSTFSYGGEITVTIFEDNVRCEIVKQLDTFNRQSAAKEVTQKDVTLRFR